MRTAAGAAWRSSAVRQAKAASRTAACCSHSCFSTAGTTASLTAASTSRGDEARVCGRLSTSAVASGNRQAPRPGGRKLSGWYSDSQPGTAVAVPKAVAISGSSRRAGSVPCGAAHTRASSTSCRRPRVATRAQEPTSPRMSRA